MEAHCLDLKFEMSSVSISYLDAHLFLSSEGNQKLEVGGFFFPIRLESQNFP